MKFNRIIKSVLFVLAASFILWGCSEPETEETGSVSFTISSDVADAIETAGAQSSYRSVNPSNLFFKISIKGDYEAEKTIAATAGSTATFDGIPVYKRIHAEASAYEQNSDGTHNVLYTGTSNTIVIRKGTNTLSLALQATGNTSSSGGSGGTGGSSGGGGSSGTGGGGSGTGGGGSSSVTYTITFNTDGGTPSVTSQNIASGGTATEPTTVPTKTGDRTSYVFLGWKNGDTLYDFSTPVTGNVDLTAMWLEGFVKVNGATVTSEFNNTNSNCAAVFNGRSITIPTMYVCDHEVTQAEFEAVMGTNPSYFDGSTGKNPDATTASGETQAKRPVEMVSWYDAIAYCNKKSANENLTPCYTISEITDWTNFSYNSIPTSNDDTWNAVTCNWSANGYRLPTEAEWEYIARGGNNGIPSTQTEYSGSNVLSDVAWYLDNSGNKTHEVKKKNANTRGIYDMSGNVYEWCWDWRTNTIDNNTPATGPANPVPKPNYSYNYGRIIRSGYFNAGNVYLYSVYGQNDDDPYKRVRSYGFRVVRTVQ